MYIMTFSERLGRARFPSTQPPAHAIDAAVGRRPSPCRMATLRGLTRGPHLGYILIYIYIHTHNTLYIYTCVFRVYIYTYNTMHCTILYDTILELLL